MEFTLALEFTFSSQQKLNYTHDHYVAISKQTFKEQTMDIEKIAKENLTQIGAMFKNE